MATGTKICKVCGKEYPYCKTFKQTGVFRYQDVACCPEHGAIYFEKVAKARSMQEPEPMIDEEILDVEDDEDEEDDDELFEEQIDDDEDIDLYLE